MLGYLKAQKFSRPYNGFIISGNWLKTNVHANCWVSLKTTTENMMKLTPRDKPILSAAIQKRIIFNAADEAFFHAPTGEKVVK